MIVLGPDRRGALGVIGLLVPFVVRAWVLQQVARKRKAFAEQLPDNLDVLASALRAGHSLVGALAVVADDAVEPSKSEFRRVLAEEQFGVQLEDAFQVVVERMENKDLDQVALVARLQREVGSNSAEVLDRVVETVRGRMELRRLVRTLTAQGRFSRWVLTALPGGAGADPCDRRAELHAPALPHEHGTAAACHSRRDDRARLVHHQANRGHQDLGARHVDPAHPRRRPHRIRRRARSVGGAAAADPPRQEPRQIEAYGYAGKPEAPSKPPRMSTRKSLDKLASSVGDFVARGSSTSGRTRSSGS